VDEIMISIIGDVCTDPDAMRVLLFVKNLIVIAKFGIPLVIIVLASIDFAKLTVGSHPEEIKKAATKLAYRIASAVIVFFVPSIVSLVYGLVTDGVNVNACFDNATSENIKLAYEKRADILVVAAEASLKVADYEMAYSEVTLLEDGTSKSNYLSRLATVKKTIEDKGNGAIVSSRIVGSSSSSGGGTNSGGLSISGSYSSSGDATTKPCIKLDYEPDPSAALNYWGSLNYIDSSQFVYPKDEATGLPLGAWPKNYASIRKSIAYSKVYKGEFIFPVTPYHNNEKGVYYTVYPHNGIDIMSKIGEPIYSPVDGTLIYMEWGHTVNKGSDETAYSATIYPDNPITLGGGKINRVFLTHMSGIVSRCPSGSCSKKIKKGELVGFVGTAAGSATSAGYAPHLHMTLFYDKTSSAGVGTSVIENDLYGLTNGKRIEAGK